MDKGEKERAMVKIKVKNQGEMKWTRMNDKEEAEGTVDKDEGQ